MIPTRQKASIEITRIRKTLAFTLIELLAVIAVIGILAAILIPTVSSVRASSWKSTDASNLRQLVNASLMYANLHGGRILPHRFDSEDAGKNRHWPYRLIEEGLLEGNTNSNPLREDYFYSPAAKVSSFEEAEQEGLQWSLAISYGMRQWREPGESSATLGEAKLLTSIKDPSNFFLFANSGRPSGTGWYMIGTGGNTSSHRIHLVHPGERAALAFADGSVRLMNQEEIESMLEEQSEYGFGDPIHRVHPED